MEKPGMSLEETLLPSLLQCFGIMFLGYILGRFEILRQKEAKGLSTFVQYLALPALIFVRISTISFQDVKWAFIASVFVSKAFIFICVILMTMLLTHPPDLGKAAIYAIAATQSNDFALAYPMFKSLYENTHSDYPEYLYIIAPIQLVVINMIGFFIIEIQKHKQGDDVASCHFLKVLKNTLKNPIVFMTVIAMVWNVSFGNQVLSIFNAILNVLSAAFPATALILVGHTMSIKGQKSDSHIPITVGLLIIAKNLILPIILQKFSTLMLKGSNESEIQSLSSFGFLYGTAPTAPSAYVFAAQYDISVDVITKTIIGSTLLSAPMMFASASVITISQFGIKNIAFYLSATISYLSCASLICCSILLMFCIIGKWFQNISFKVTLYIFFTQLLTSIGGILLFFSVPDNSPIFYVQYILSVGGIYATRVCTLFLAVLLCIIRWRSLCYILQARKHINVISVLCLFFPCIIAALILLIKDIKSDGPNCQLGYAQNITTFVLTLICFLGTVLCLILQHVCFRRKLIKNTTINIAEDYYQTCDESENILPHTSVNVRKTANKSSFEEEICVDVEEIDKHLGNILADSQNLFPDNIQDNLCDSRYHCSVKKRLECASRVSIYHKEEENVGLYDDIEIFQHTTLLIALCVSMTVSLAVCFGKLITEEVNGIFIELEFVDTIINYSLGIVFFIIFGFNKGLIHTISKKLKLLWCCKKKSQLEISSVDICNEFMTKYEKKFKAHIKNSKTFPCNEYQNLFCSSDLIKWLVKSRGIKEPSEADVYILSLLEGNVIEKIDKCEFFPDDLSIFKFTNICNKI